MAVYDFRNLSPHDFERLSRDVLNSAEGLNLQTYPEGRDRGIDLRQITRTGYTIIGQCKHYVGSTAAQLKAAVEKELAKEGWRKADRYLLVTSRPITAEVQSELAETLRIPASDVWGPDRLNDALRDDPEIVKRHFKLWLSSTAALERVLRAGVWNRTEVLLREAAEDCRRWIEVPLARDARDGLAATGLCVITGLPGTGKTTLAKQLVLEAAAEGWQVVQVRSPNEAWETLRPERQIFYYDDFLGQSRLTATADADVADLLSLIGTVHREKERKRLVLTTRSQVLRAAEQAINDKLQEAVRRPRRHTIVLDEIDRSIRTSIITSHLHFAGFPADESERLEADRRMSRVVGHPNFSPRAIEHVSRRLGEDATADDAVALLQRTFDDPGELWRVSFAPLNELSREIVLTLATLPTQPVDLADLHELVGRPDPFAWRNALHTLEPTWVRLIDSPVERTVRLAHPGCHDYLLSVIDQPEAAAERLDRVRRIDQVFTLSEAAGLLDRDPPPPHQGTRPHLLNALRSRREQLVELIRTRFEAWSSVDRRPSLRAATLRDVAILHGALGDPDSPAWIEKHCHALTESAWLRPPPFRPGHLFSLAAALI
ncbi:restriction endonuclease, partial [Actinomadura sp. KC345]|uniref:nSTAND3 domain-containing NTPase n=1 Tax=Actinomadura sp. KC345 TaxID=2530371 RepID=UPI001404D749